jgi:hypothetical protein
MARCLVPCLRKRNTVDSAADYGQFTDNPSNYNCPLSDWLVKFSP